MEKVFRFGLPVRYGKLVFSQAIAQPRREMFRVAMVKLCLTFGCAKRRNRKSARKKSITMKFLTFQDDFRTNG